MPKKRSLSRKRKGPKSKKSKQDDKPKPILPLILTSEKKRGLECDYCRTDISQVPRIRCAICPDFDLCLECFLTTDPEAAKSRYAVHKHSNNASAGGTSNVLEQMGGVEEQQYLHKQQQDSESRMIGTSMSGEGGGGGGGDVPSAYLLQQPTIQHDKSHGYRVADSTRFFLFPSLRGVEPAPTNPVAAPVVGVPPATTTSDFGSSASSTTVNNSATAAAAKDDDTNTNSKAKTKKVVANAMTDDDDGIVTKDNNEINVDSNAKSDIVSTTEPTPKYVNDASEETTTTKEVNDTSEETAKKDNDDPPPPPPSSSEPEKSTTKEEIEIETKEKNAASNDCSDGDVSMKDNTVTDNIAKDDNEKLSVEKEIETKEKDNLDKASDADGDGDVSMKNNDMNDDAAKDNNDVNNDATKDNKDDAPLSSAADAKNNSDSDKLNVEKDVEVKEKKNLDTKEIDGDVSMKNNNVIDDVAKDNNDDHPSSTDADNTKPEKLNVEKDVETKEDNGLDKNNNDDGDVNMKNKILEEKDDGTSTIAKSAMEVTETTPNNAFSDAPPLPPPATATTTTLPSSAEESNNITQKKEKEIPIVVDDPKTMWTAEEDLRLLEAISNDGLGNWPEIADTVGNGKSAKRCMERYIDDYLGKYGRIVPEYTLVEIKDEDIMVEVDDGAVAAAAGTVDSVVDSQNTEENKEKDDKISSKHVFIGNCNKNYKVVKSTSLPGYEKIWPNPYIPPIPGVKLDDDVGRDKAVRSEQTFLKTLSAACADGCSEEEIQKIRREWTNNPNRETRVLPPQLEDIQKMPGSDLMGYMPRRGDFDVEWDNDAEAILAEMTFSHNDNPEDRALKIQVTEIYNAKLDEREQRKQFLKDHNLIDYRKKQMEDQMRPSDERDLINRMRLFARFHSPKAHENFINDLLKAKRLRKEIAKLQMYRRMGITSLAEAEKFELDRDRKMHHTAAWREKEEEEQEALAAAENEDDGPTNVWSKYSVSSSNRKRRRLSEAHSDGQIRDNSTEGEKKKDSTKVEFENNNSKDETKETKNDSDVEAVSSSAANTEGGEVDLSGESTESENSQIQKLPDGETTSLVGDSASVEKQGADNDVAMHKDKEDETVPAKENPMDKKAKGNDKRPSKKSKSSKSKQSSASNIEIKKSPGYELMSSEEKGLCQRLEIQPNHYLEVKTALINESLRNSMGVQVSENSEPIFKIDVEKRDNVVEFIIQSGWVVPNKCNS